MCFTQNKDQTPLSTWNSMSRGGWGEKVINYLLRVLRDASSNNDWGLNVWL